MFANHEKERVSPDFPFLFFTVDTIQCGPHWHEELEIVHVLDGTLHVGANTQQYILQKDDILFIGGGQIHYFDRQSTQNKTAFIQLNRSFIDTLTQIRKTNDFKRFFLGTIYPIYAADNEQIHRAITPHLRDIIHEYHRAAPAYEIVLKARIYDIIALLMRHTPAIGDNASPDSQYMERLSRLEKVFSYIDEHLGEPITLLDIARIAHFSRFHFTRFFKETTGMTFRHYLQHQRIRKAQSLLLATNEPVTGIALETGFVCITTFNRLFRDITGTTPSAFRKTAIPEK